MIDKNDEFDVFFVEAKNKIKEISDKARYIIVIFDEKNNFTMVENFGDVVQTYLKQLSEVELDRKYYQ